MNPKDETQADAGYRVNTTILAVLLSRHVNNAIERYVVEHCLTAVLLAAVGVVASVFILILMMAMESSYTWMPQAISWIFLVSILVGSFSFPFVLFSGVLKNALRMVGLWIASVSAFSGFYFVNAMISDYRAKEEISFSGLETSWVLSKGNDLTPICNTVYNCIHFSLVNSMSFGDQNISPKSIEFKIYSDIQKIFSFGLIVIGITLISSKNGSEVSPNESLHRTAK